LILEKSLIGRVLLPCGKLGEGFWGQIKVIRSSCRYKKGINKKEI